MRLVCLHADTVDAFKRLKIQFDDLTPTGLWSSQYHLVGLTPDQFEALELFQVDAEDITPAQLAQAVTDRPKGAAAEGAVGTPRPASAARPETPVPGAETGEREAARAGGASESEVPLEQARDSGAKGVDVRAETKTETKPDGRTPTQISPQARPQNPSAQASGAQQGQGQGQGQGQKGGGPQVAPPAQGNRKGQPAQAQGQTGGQRYGTTRLRISVAGKYTEATVANGKIVVAGRSFDSPDQAAAELTKSRGDWTFWEYYDSADGKWRMLTRDWDTVLKSAAPGGR
jgi:hypothetical protein